MGTSGVGAGAVKAPPGLAQVQLSSICQHLGSCALWRGLSCATIWTEHPQDLVMQLAQLH